MAREPRAGHAEGMADRDRAAVDVVFRRIDAELVAAVEALAGERLIELPEIDVVDLEAMALQQFWHGVDRADAHLVGFAASSSPGDEAAERMQAALLRVLGFHQHDGGSTVRELAGVARGDVFAGAPHRFELGEAFHRRVGTVALVLVDDIVDDALGLGRLVDHFHLRLHRDDFVLELVGLLGCRHAALRFQRELVLVFAADLVALGNNIGGIDHSHENVGRDFQQLRIDRFLRRAAAGDRDALDAAGHDALGAVRADRIGGHRDGLQARRAETVDRHAAG